MKVFAILGTLIAGAVAQAAVVTEPKSGDTWAANQDHLVTVARQISVRYILRILGKQALSDNNTYPYLLYQDDTTAVTEIGIAISIKHCSQSPCEDMSSALGAVLYAGTYNPVMDYDLGYSYQNFTLTIPGFESGEAAISVAHASLVNVSKTGLQIIT